MASPEAEVSLDVCVLLAVGKHVVGSHHVVSVDTDKKRCHEASNSTCSKLKWSASLVSHTPETTGPQS